MLRLQTQTGPKSEDAPLARRLAVHEIARIELQAWLRRADFQNAAAAGIGEHGGQTQRGAGARRLEDPIVIVAASELQLFVDALDAGTDGGRAPEIERRSRHGAFFPGRYQIRIHRRKGIRVDLQRVAENRSMWISG